MSGGGGGGSGLYLSCAWTGCGGGVVCDYLGYLVAYTHLRLMNLIPYSYVAVVLLLLVATGARDVRFRVFRTTTHLSRDTTTE